MTKMDVEGGGQGVKLIIGETSLPVGHSLNVTRNALVTARVPKSECKCVYSLLLFLIVY